MLFGIVPVTVQLAVVRMVIVIVIVISMAVRVCVLDTIEMLVHVEVSFFVVVIVLAAHNLAVSPLNEGAPSSPGACN